RKLVLITGIRGPLGRPGSEIRDQPGRTQNIQYSGRETQEQENNQAPGRRTGHPVDEPAKTRTHDNPGNELAGKPQRIAESSDAVGLRVSAPFRLFGPSRCKRGLKFATPTIQIVRL